MNLFYLIMLLFLFQQSELTLHGTVVVEKEAMPSSIVRIKGTDNEVMTDINGQFSLPIAKDMDNFILEITHPEKSVSATTQITDIQPQGRSLNLGKLSLILNEFIGIDEYERLNEKAKKNYQPMYHWHQLLGYFHKSKIDITNLKIPCPFNLNEEIDYEYNQVGNKIIIDYSTLQRCK